MWDLTCRNAEHLQLLMNLMGAGLCMYETLHNTKYPTKKNKQKTPKHESGSWSGHRIRRQFHCTSVPSHESGSNKCKSMKALDQVTRKLNPGKLGLNENYLSCAVHERNQQRNNLNNKNKCKSLRIFIQERQVKGIQTLIWQLQHFNIFVHKFIFTMKPNE